ncbi:methyltransferase family protein [Mycobacteroides salmoniphilum]|uniref:Isoprenylcysteine carboxyl methyltransferase (ICMT) family protein n=1 Tax=Mycobacteroides salmoniphilum TaxID=404941 RepID=A0A4R8SI69_9MYCO|nr:isoprenylcysteine carboxylmethyltransferase family protein [Mycobacteroides salmoniphilum]TDZ96683.1 Isoprenylcysteine carboxyl methyltransferase (ICMT) family protein [Mycobacteroides salmoniphilum]TEA05778.1 Isoprenylcysteine carboxyl methyltransferase (ICMT) family protein [Mycobacteroides salmoniphilum]
MKAIARVLALGLVELAVFGSVLFLLAGTFDYWQVWVFLVVFALSTWIPTVYLQQANPAAHERRKHAGPAAETRTVQKVLIGGWYMSLAALIVISALDHRFGWSSVPSAICVIGDVLVAVGLGITSLVVIQNSFAASTVQVETGQTVASTGLYGLVRHPMYTGNVITIVGFPLALGSYWGLVAVVPGLVALIVRIRDEERLLVEQLDGYREYAQKARYRLAPYVW